MLQMISGERINIYWSESITIEKVRNTNSEDDAGR